MLLDDLHFLSRSHVLCIPLTDRNYLTAHIPLAQFVPNFAELSYIGTIVVQVLEVWGARGLRYLTDSVHVFCTLISTQASPPADIGAISE